MRLNLTTEKEWLSPDLILRSHLILHAAATLHCKTTGIFHAARRCWSTAYAARLPSLTQVANMALAQHKPLPQCKLQRKGGVSSQCWQTSKTKNCFFLLFLFLKDKSQSKDKAFELNVNSNDRATSKRRIFEKGGKRVGNLRIMQTKRNRSSLIISPFSCPKLGEDQKKKGLHSDLVRFLAKKKKMVFTYCRFSPVFGQN